MEGGSTNQTHSTALKAQGRSVIALALFAIPRGIREVPAIQTILTEVSSVWQRTKTDKDLGNGGSIRCLDTAGCSTGTVTGCAAVIGEEDVTILALRTRQAGYSRLCVHERVCM